MIFFIKTKYFLLFPSEHLQHILSCFQQVVFKFFQELIKSSIISIYLNESFIFLITVIVWMGSPIVFANCWTASVFTRINGLISFSSAIVDGTVGSPAACFAFAHSIFAEIISLFGSTWFAYFKFWSEYSWPQKTFVSSGSFDSFSISAEYICSAVPSKNRPQPLRNKVSPVNTALSLAGVSTK